MTAVPATRPNRRAYALSASCTTEVGRNRGSEYVVPASVVTMRGFRLEEAALIEDVQQRERRHDDEHRGVGVVLLDRAVVGDQRDRRPRDTERYENDVEAQRDRHLRTREGQLG